MNSRLLIGLILGLIFPALACAVPFSDEVKTRQSLVQVALAREPADLIVQAGWLLNVVTGEWLQDQDIVVSHDRIAWTGPRNGWPGTSKRIIKAHKEWLVPGFGESHKHIESSYLTPEYEASLVIPFGNTWTMEGSHETSNVIGSHNAEFWLQAERAGSPLKIFPSIGSATPPTVYEKGGGYYGYKEMSEFLDYDKRVAALGEVMDWTAVNNPKSPGHQRIWEMIQATWDKRAVVEGHGSGLYGAEEINAFAAACLSSDHEVRQQAEGLEKLRRGVFLEVRANTTPELFPFLIKQGISDWSNVSVTTDDRDVHAALQLGSMDYNIRTAIEAGIPTIIAYQMGSYNTARHFHVDNLVGSISPGRYADLVFLSDPDKVAITRVMANGKMAAEKGRYLLPVTKVTYPEWAFKTMNIGRKIVADDFVIKAPPGRSEVNVALMQPFYFEPDFIKAVMPVTNGVVLPDSGRSISKVAVIDRYSGKGSVSKMFWQNVGPITPNSALACSQSHDLHNIWALGNDDAAMAMAVNAVADMEGGWALVNGGKVVARVKLNISGLMSQHPVNEVAAEVEALYKAADAMQWINAPGLPERMRFAFLTASPWKWQLVAPYEGNPVGFVNVTTGETHPVIW